MNEIYNAVELVSNLNNNPTFESAIKKNDLNNSLNMTGKSTQFGTEAKTRSFVDTMSSNKNDFGSTMKSAKSEKRAKTPDLTATRKSRSSPKTSTHNEIIKEKLSMSPDFNTWDAFKLLNKESKSSITSVDVQHGLESLRVFRSL